jgi:RsiW-degrading membrane proteinase PrsW (M82 family)
MILLALAIAPGLVISLYIFYKDTYNAEPTRYLLISFILGAMMVIPAGLIEQTVTPFFSDRISSIAAYSYLGVGFTEEFLKFLVLRYYAFNKKSFDEPLDGIVYSVIAGMGFATLENIMYVTSMGLSTALLRMVLSVPAHATFAVLMGYHAGKAKFSSSGRFLHLLCGLCLAVFFHGTFDFFLFLRRSPQVQPFISEGLLFLGAVASFIFALRLSRRQIEEHRLLSQQTYNSTHRV